MLLIEKDHWEKMFSTKTETEFSWFQAYPTTSVAFLELFNLPKDAHIIDIGGGDSHLVDVLVEREYQNIYVLDISENALNRAKQRLGEKSKKVHWIVSDVVDFVSPVLFDFWHDRAAFHFLTTSERIEQYVNNAERSIKSGGYLILGTFSENGPKKCSGLEIKQYTEASMSKRFEEKFDRIKCIEEEHQTPFNTTQHFLFCSFKKKN
ncbi:MAG TPA: class I SAM-dependent methyltransferase [Sediminibacterium sp.]|nr:class I SAM-dependent methyltransferase [Sediminibacterium sp.]